MSRTKKPTTLHEEIASLFLDDAKTKADVRVAAEAFAASEPDVLNANQRQWYDAMTALAEGPPATLGVTATRRYARRAREALARTENPTIVGHAQAMVAMVAMVDVYPDDATRPARYRRKADLVTASS